jgi:phosphonoacetaldehyde hydrolase
MQAAPLRYDSPRRVEAAILDWAGTVIDFGSFAPTQIFVEAFAALGIPLTLEEARGPMGMGKWDHIRALCNEPAIAARFGRTPTDADVTAIYERFMPLQIARIAEHSALIPGALDAIAALRGRGIKIGSCSGYPGAVMREVVAKAAANGYVADHVVATDEVPKGRPYPTQSLANAVALAVSDVAACVKVDDTVPGILEGRRAGMWTVALLCSGNELGLDYAAYRALPPERLAAERARIAALFAPSRPHFAVDTIAELPGVVDEIERLLATGVLPQCR